MVWKCDRVMRMNKDDFVVSMRVRLRERALGEATSEMCL